MSSESDNYTKYFVREKFIKAFDDHGFEQDAEREEQIEHGKAVHQKQEECNRVKSNSDRSNLKKVLIIVFYVCVFIAASLWDLFRRGRRPGAGDASSSAGGVHDPHVAQRATRVQGSGCLRHQRTQQERRQSATNRKLVQNSGKIFSPTESLSVASVIDAYNRVNVHVHVQYMYCIYLIQSCRM